ncbi:FAD-dependent oxidoreductase [Saccharopolyspora pogona]
MHFAGDWTSPTAGTHGALGAAKRVADAVLTEET